MSAYIYSGGTLRETWDDATRTFTEYNAQGQQTSTRPYTAGENVAADAAITAEQAREAEEQHQAIQRALVPQTVALLTALAQTHPDVIAAANGSYWSGQEQGQPWHPVTSYVDAYPVGWEVTHDGKTWVSLRDGASGEPGVVPGDWQEKQSPGQVVDWVQPHAGAEYPVGALVKHNGRIWRNDHTGPNGWQPGTAHSGWTDIGPA